MKATTDKPGSDRSGRGKRLGWFLLIWAAGVVVIATVGYGLKAVVGFIYGGG